MQTSYDTIGVDYSDLRNPDPRIGMLIEKALGPASTVLNVGAGTGSYEPAGRQVTAVEPSEEMISQRPDSAAPVIQGYAEDLPFDDSAFDASMAILTVHHWSDKVKGLKEMRRVTRGPVVILTFDPAFQGFWLFDYIPELMTVDDGRMPGITEYAEVLGPVDILPVPIAHDCTDGFLCAYWRRPAAYLDSKIRAAISCFWVMGDFSEGLKRLERDLETGAWAERYPELMNCDELDLGYRLVSTK